jgi:REP element-mobilizing transposase RayT
MGGIVNTLDGTAEAVGGVADHVHLVLGLKATHRVSDVLREIKSVSSAWVHEDIGLKSFAWQEGYGAFTVSPSNLAAVRDYVGNQEEHHRTRSFREEYEMLLKRHGIEFDDRYVF